MLPNGPDIRRRRRCWGRREYVFLAIVIALFLYAGFSSGHNPHPDITLAPVTNKLDELAKSPSRMFNNIAASLTRSVVTEHPIPRLMDDAEDQFRRKLKRQSKTLPAAVAEYKKRYRRDPPKGFGDWWDFAKQHDFKMVDEFDGLMNDLDPFWFLPGEEIRRRTDQVGHLPSIHLVRVRDGKTSTVKMNHAFEDSEVSARAHGFRSMLSKFESKLPDMDFSINAQAEGRVLVSYEHRTEPNSTLQNSSAGIDAMLGGPFVPDWGDHGNIWQSWRRTCPHNTTARRLFSSLRNPFVNQAKNYYLMSSTVDPASPGSDFKFMSTTNDVIDFCQTPHAHQLQGHFFSDWRCISALYPVFTPATAQGFMDIKIPSHYYYGSTKRYTYGWDPVNLELKDVDPMEVPWEQKIDKVFWRGATTGGGSHPPGFSPQYQRHRFLRMASTGHDSTLNRTVTFEDPPNSGRYISTRVSATDLNGEVMDTAFVKAVAAESYPGGEDALRRDHRFGDAVPLGEHWRYRYLVDLDGMSYSGRFLAFLASDSVPIKATVYKEWFSDWIQPWVHFIPLSSTYQEIYNIIAYFSGPTYSTLLAANRTSSANGLSGYSVAALANEEVLRSGEGRKTMVGIDADRRLRRIARAGKQWKKTMARKVDMEIYVYRLCLEWARLWADDRDSMRFEL